MSRAPDSKPLQFDNFTVFKPASYHEKSLHQMFDQVIAWGGALKSLRTTEAGG